MVWWIYILMLSRSNKSWNESIYSEEHQWCFGLFWIYIRRKVILGISNDIYPNKLPNGTFCKFWSYLRIWSKHQKHSRQITWALTTVYIGRKFRTNTIWDSTHQISDAIFIGITVAFIECAWTCTWTARPHIFTICTLNKNFFKNIFE